MIFLLIFFALSLPSPVRASSSDIVNTTVKVNVCGNGKVESPAEDCEGTVLNGATCSSLGLGSGTLSCDPACTYNTSLCELLPSPTPTPNRSTTTSSDNLPPPTPTLLTPTPTPIPLLFSPLPPPLRRILSTLGLTTDSFGRQHLNPVLTHWVSSWRGEGAIPNSLANCDINEDSICNLTDLSVLLFYVGN